MVALVTVRHSPTPPNIWSVMFRSKAALRGPKLLKMARSSIACSEDMDSLSFAGFGFARGIGRLVPRS